MSRNVDLFNFKPQLSSQLLGSPNCRIEICNWPYFFLSQVIHQTRKTRRSNNFDRRKLYDLLNFLRQFFFLDSPGHRIKHEIPFCSRLYEKVLNSPSPFGDVRNCHCILVAVDCPNLGLHAHYIFGVTNWDLHQVSHMTYLDAVSVQAPRFLTFDRNYAPYPLVYHRLADNRVASYLFAHEIVGDFIALSLLHDRPRIIAVSI